MPAKDQDFYALKNVPHGQLREIHFFSKSTDSVRHAFIYTPPGYDQDLEKRYPVLYLQHGWGENEYGWGVQGCAALIMDNLIAEAKAKPFIIVMTYGMTNDTPRRDSEVFDIKPFETVLVEQLIPYTDSNFRTLSDQPNRAMAGLHGRHGNQDDHPEASREVLAHLASSAAAASVRAHLRYGRV